MKRAEESTGESCLFVDNVPVKRSDGEMSLRLHSQCRRSTLPAEAARRTPVGFPRKRATSVKTTTTKNRSIRLKKKK